MRADLCQIGHAAAYSGILDANVDRRVHRRSLGFHHENNPWGCFRLDRILDGSAAGSSGDSLAQVRGSGAGRALKRSKACNEIRASGVEESYFCYGVPRDASLPFDHQEKTMGMLKGQIDKAVGKTKEKIGYAIGSDKLQVEGAAQALKGRAETEVSKKADKVRKAVNDATNKL